MKKKTKKRLYIISSITASVLFVAAAVYGYSLYESVTARFISRGFPSPSVVYSCTLYLKSGMGVSEDMLVNKLERLGYQETPGMPFTFGSYSISGNTVSLYTRGFKMPAYNISPTTAVLQFSNHSISEITANDGTTMNGIELEPEQLAVFFGDDFKMRMPVNLPSIPDNLINAVITTEDARFFEHGAIDLSSIFRAMLADLSSMSIKQGGSTITQQLVKTLFLSNRRTFRRKIVEAVMALMIAHRFTKAQILNAYLNDVYLGQDGHVNITGMGAAARYYFSSPIERLTLSQCAMLAGMIASPNRFSPISSPAEAFRRRNYVLSRMKDYNVITNEEYIKAMAEPLGVAVTHITVKSAPYFVDYVADQLELKFSKELLTGQGLRIFTTIDMDAQLMAEKAMAEAPRRLEGAMVVIQPQTGYVLAMIGGRDYAKSQFNRAVLSQRQIGSCVKPFIYMLAFDDLAKKGFSQATEIDDAPLKIKTGTTEWEPHNYDDKFRGYMSARYALQHSINVPAVKVAMETGLENISQELETLGLGTDIPAFPSIALGSISTSPLDLCLAYTIFSNNGYEPLEPISIKAVTDMHNNIVLKTDLGFNPAAPAQGCYIVDNVLLGSETEGTARGLRKFDIQGEYAGKTGTTNDFRDTWFAGYTPDVVAVDWMGYDNSLRIGEPSSAVALPVVGKFLGLYTRMYGGRAFDSPSGIKFACVDKYTGLAGDKATDCVQGAFIAGTEPEKGAVKSIIDWFRHLFNK